MTNEIKTLLNDEILHFLYSNASFQGLEEAEQQQFLARFLQHDVFKEMIEISIELEETIKEVEATMPKMQDKDYLFAQEAQRQLLKERTVVSDNVYYVPFEELENIYSPMIIAVQQSDSMQEFEAFCKGIILPLFNLSAIQKRDLIIIPFGRTVSKPLHFKNGLLHVESFGKFINDNNDGEAQIVPALEAALSIFKEDVIDNQRDLMILTDNQFTDFNALIQQDFSQLLQDLLIDVSVIAMSEVDFEVQPIPFADKVFFANE